MKEYIERETALREINGQFPDAHYPSWYAALIEKIPAADVVSVVRCKNCKWWTGSECRNANGANTTVFNPYWFCGSGQRKETKNG